MIYSLHGGLMLIYDTRFHLPIADDQLQCLAFTPPSRQTLHAALDSMILSSSGWRKVFAKSGDEEDATYEIQDQDAVLASLAALALARHLGLPAAQKQAVQIGRPSHTMGDVTILVGLDARPTGRILGDIVVRTLLSLGCKVRYLFITPAPQIMADCNLHPQEADAFLYISASHNPIGHNGFKFGKQGGVYSGEEAEQLSRIFRTLVKEEENAVSYVQSCVTALDPKVYRTVLEAVKKEQEQSLDRYETFILSTAAKSDDPIEHKRFIAGLQQEHKKQALGVVGELNGSARSVSIDQNILGRLGVKTYFLHDRPGDVVHAIVPEGENLSLCRDTLSDLYQKDAAFRLGYVPDNDGDRGNLVYIEEKTGTAHILEAQNVFALVVLAELSQTRLKHPKALLATVVNGPTSRRIEQIAQAFDAEVFRCEVGEANVVQLAQQKREEGYLVPILGEGSNGGNITFPAKVRDPLNTLLSLIKLLRNRDIPKLWFRSNGLDVPHPISLERIIESLPVYTTTGAFSKDGKMNIHQSHQVLKNRYEVLFLSDWESKKEQLAAMGIHSYAILQTEGIVCTEGMGEAFRHAPYSGGYSVVLKDEEGLITDVMWMRGSKTEPVFRVLVDCKTDDQNRHDFLLAWHRDLIARSDLA